MSKTIQVKAVFQPEELRELSTQFYKDIENDIPPQRDTVERAAELLEFTCCWFEQNQDKVNSSNAPSPFTGKGTGDGVCVIRPNMHKLQRLHDLFKEINANYDVTLLDNTIRYIEFLEQQHRTNQETETLSLTSLRAQRDALRKEADRMRVCVQYFITRVEQGSISSVRTKAMFDQAISEFPRNSKQQA